MVITKLRFILGLLLIAFAPHYVLCELPPVGLRELPRDVAHPGNPLEFLTPGHRDLKGRGYYTGCLLRYWGNLKNDPGKDTYNPSKVCWPTWKQHRIQCEQTFRPTPEELTRATQFDSFWEQVSVCSTSSSNHYKKGIFCPDGQFPVFSWRVLSVCMRNLAMELPPSTNPLLSPNDVKKKPRKRPGSDSDRGRNKMSFQSTLEQVGKEISERFFGAKEADRPSSALSNGVSPGRVSGQGKFFKVAPR